MKDQSIYIYEAKHKKQVNISSNMRFQCSGCLRPSLALSARQAESELRPVKNVT